jgi:hypothetical protein
MKTIKIGKMPGLLTEIVVEDNTTVAQAAEIAGLDVNGYEPRVAGSVVTPSTTVQDGQTVLFVQKIKGNAEITVKVGKMPGILNTYVVESGTKVGEILTMAGFDDISGFEIRMAGATVSNNDLVTTDGATILLVARIKGNTERK